MLTVAIQTRFIGPSNTLGSRVGARTMRNHGRRYDGTRTDGKNERLILDWDHTLNPERNHIAAAHKLATRLGWDGAWFAGSTDDGYVFVRQEGAYGANASGVAFVVAPRD